MTRGPYTLQDEGDSILLTIRGNTSTIVDNGHEFVASTRDKDGRCLCACTIIDLAILVDDATKGA